jgi:hypothetical protein
MAYMFLQFQRQTPDDSLGSRHHGLESRAGAIRSSPWRGDMRFPFRPRVWWVRTGRRGRDLSLPYGLFLMHRKSYRVELLWPHNCNSVAFRPNKRHPMQEGRNPPDKKNPRPGRSGCESHSSFYSSMVPGITEPDDMGRRSTLSGRASPPARRRRPSSRARCCCCCC